MPPTVGEWFCSCGSGIVGDVLSVDTFRGKHVAQYPGHWPVSMDEWLDQPCEHCACFDGERDGSVTCCACDEPYQPMVEIGGRRMFIKDAVGVA
jgi:hypothetical protein